MSTPILATSLWFIIWWAYALYDVFFSRSHEIIPSKIWGIKISPFSQHILKVLVFPLYVLYHCIAILIKFIQYLCIDLFYEVILKSLAQIVGLVLKGIIQILKKIVD